MSNLAVVLVVVLSVGCMGQSAPQAKQSQAPRTNKTDAVPADLRAVIVGLNEDVETLTQMAPSLGGYEGNNASSTSAAIQVAQIAIGGASFLIEPYDKMGCDQDRQVMKGILQKGLPFYAEMLDLKLKDLSGYAGLTKSPAISQVAIRAEDRIRSAKRGIQSVLDTVQ